MKAAFHYLTDFPHQKPALEGMAEGMRRHGFTVDFSADDIPFESDIVVMWGQRQKAVLAMAKQRNVPVLVMERGHVQPRILWTSCGFNGLGRRGAYPSAQDGGARWNKHFAHHLKPWRMAGSYALVCGQLQADVALGNLDIRAWTQNIIDALRAKGLAVRYRPHPYEKLVGENWVPRNAEISASPAAKEVHDASNLADDLRDARMVVTYNSTSGVESVLAGVPTIAENEGAMAWPMATHSIEETLVMPDRTSWCHDLAWTQWLPEEIQNGTAWASVKSCIRL
jgi:hypothetical protein